MANYKIIGADGVERGPVSPETVRLWIAEQRLRAESKVRLEGATEWVTLASLPEFGDALKTVPPPVFGNPPPLSGNPIPSAGNPSPMAKQTNVMAILSLVFSLLGIVICITSPVGLILGIISLVKISKSKGQLGGFGFALTGVIVGALGLLVGPAMLLPALAAAKNKAEVITCLNHERQLALAIRIYAQEHNNQMPPADQWCDVISVSSTNVFKCPKSGLPTRCDYAFNAKLGGMYVDQISPKTVMLFESDGGWNANGGADQMVDPPRHRAAYGVYCVAFADGHVEMLRSTNLLKLRWDP